MSTTSANGKRRHGRAGPGHPRLACCKKVVDARHKAGHDGGCISIASLVIGLALGITPAEAQSAADFYRGNTIKFHLASEPGGGFDLIARSFAKYFVNYVPGKPTIVLVNMPGGGGTILANRAYNVAPKDGSASGMGVSS